ncbi:MAG: TonB-dependent receptor plug domain-containing protein [Proteobacteria bacterium]|nr:TonB-dependent receptor plug domain-containing protein [Pseudomonadota bacterium]
MISRTSRLGTAKAAALFGTASFMVMAGTSAAQAQQVAQAPIEEILITGSLIAGAPVVGIPVTALGQEDFAEAGVLTTTELMRNVPSLQVQTTVTPLAGGGRTSYSQNVNIHGFSGSGGDPITLLLINGRRWPIQGHGQDTIDPSIVPAIAVDRVDILTVGASATYGSDAVSGVINVIMRRGYDGAMTRVRYSTSTDIGGTSLSFSQLWGRSWDTGNLTMSFETYEQQRIRASARDYYTTNFETFGLGYDATPLAASMPGVVTTGRPGISDSDDDAGFDPRVGTRFCTNCMRIPHQAGWDFGSQDPGPTTNFATLQANQFIVGEDNTQNQRITYNDSWMLPQMQRSAITFAVDQELVDDFWGLGPVSFSADGFYSNRRAVMRYHSTNSGNCREHHNLRQSRGIKVPTTNPYYPAGAPEGLRVQYTFGVEMAARLTGGEIAGRYDSVFIFDDLPDVFPDY